MSLNILIADDDLLYRTLLIKTLEKVSPTSKIEACPDAFKTVDLIKDNKYDLVILDINMPVLSGIDVLNKINDIDKTLVKVLTSGTDITEEQERQAVELGVFAFIPKPQGSSADENFNTLQDNFKKVINSIHERKDKETIVEKPEETHVLAGSTEFTDVKPKPAKTKKYTEPKRFTSFDVNKGKKAEIVCIAISTGGPKLLEEIFKGMSGVKLSKPLVIVQHMPAGFTSFFVDSLQTRHEFDFVEISDELKIENKIYIARGGYHSVIESKEGELFWKLDEGPFIKGLRPAADITLNSIADHYKGRNTISIVLTGLGNDGCDGVRKLNDECNNISFVQDINECTASGMPESIMKDNLAHYKLTVLQISKLLKEVL